MNHWPSDRIGRESMKKHKGSNKADHFKLDTAISLEHGGIVGVIICSHGFRKFTSLDAARECVRTWNEKIDAKEEEAAK